MASDNIPHHGRGQVSPRTSIPVTRRTLLAAVVGMAGLAGCSDGGEGGTDADENGGPAGTETPTITATTEPTTTPTDSAATIESMCEVTDDVEGLSVVGCQSEIKSEDLLITVTVRNDGDQVADLYDHHLSATVHKSTETTGLGVTGSVVVSYPGDSEVPPGETGQATIRAAPNPDISVEDIQRYVVELSCGFGADGVYCG